MRPSGAVARRRKRGGDGRCERRGQLLCLQRRAFTLALVQRPRPRTALGGAFTLASAELQARRRRLGRVSHFCLQLNMERQSLEARNA